MNIILTGFMGTGKSTIARELADKLGLKLIDTDAMIEGLTGKKISSIFSDEGEARFREYESDVISTLTDEASKGCVVSTGGGTVVDIENRDKLKAWGVLICLSASAEAILERVGGRQDRPLLDCEDPKAAIDELLRKRADAYNDCDILIDTSNKTPLTVVKEIAEKLKG